MPRYEATIRVTVRFDAPTSHEAEAVARDLAESVSFPAPRGRDAEFVSSYARVKRKEEA